MTRDWGSQRISRSFGWFSQVWQATDYQQVLKARRTELDQALRDTQRVFKHDQTTTVACVEGAQQSLVLKRYNPRTLGHKFSRALRQTRARRCWKMSYEFDCAGLNVAPPVLMYEHRFGPIRLDAYFANVMLEGEELLSALPAMQPQEQQKVRSQLKSAFSKMRDAKLTHGDMKASNLIWVNGELFFIDLDAALKHSSRVTWSNSHNKDKKRFLKNWHGSPELLALFDFLD